jgi:hypothetical protein
MKENLAKHLGIKVKRFCKGQSKIIALISGVDFI